MNLIGSESERAQGFVSRAEHAHVCTLTVILPCRCDTDAVFGFLNIYFRAVLTIKTAAVDTDGDTDTLLVLRCGFFFGFCF